MVRRAAAGEVVLDPRLTPSDALKAIANRSPAPRELGRCCSSICDGKSNGEIGGRARAERQHGHGDLHRAQYHERARDPQDRRARRLRHPQRLGAPGRAPPDVPRRPVRRGCLDSARARALPAVLLSPGAPQAFDFWLRPGARPSLGFRLQAPPPRRVSHSRAQQRGIRGKLLPETARGRMRLPRLRRRRLAGHPARQRHRLAGHARKRSTLTLYRNNRDGTFTDVTRAAGLDTEMYGMGVAVVYWRRRRVFPICW